MSKGSKQRPTDLKSILVTMIRYLQNLLKIWINYINRKHIDKTKYNRKV